MQFKRLFFTIAFLLNVLSASLAQEPTLLDHGGGVRTVEFSPVNASLVASAGESNIIKLWNLQNDTVQTLRGHTGIVNSIAFSPNGELLASVSDDRTIKLWNVHNQQNIATLREGTLFRSVAFSPNGQLLATGGGRHVKLWDVGRQAEIATLQHDKWVEAVAFSDDSQFLAAGDRWRDGSGTVKVWDVKSRQVVATLEEDMVVVRSTTFSSKGRYLASSHYNGEVKVWDVLTWELLRTIPAGDYDIAFSPDGKMIAGTGNGYVNLWWVEDGTRVAQVPGPTGWMHPVDFSHNGASLAVGGEEGIVRIWRINTSFGDNNGSGIQILHSDTYFQQLPKANSANGDNIPDPAPPPAVVRDFYELDPYYEQWINVGGLPVIASAKVNPYAVKEAAWIIEKMIGHRPEVLRAMVNNKARFSVIPYTEIITEIPEYRSDALPDFLVYWGRGAGGTEGATVTSSEENILSYLGGGSTYNVMIHEFAHGIHLLGLKTLDPTFDERLRMTYEAAMKTGLWKGTYASSDRREYWAEGTQAWFHPNGAGSFYRFGNTRQALKAYDPDLAALLTEIYGDAEWRYTPVETRTDLPHLQGFNPQDSPIFGGWPELEALYQQLRDPNSDGGGAWVNLKPYNPDQLSSLTKSNVLGNTTAFVFVNLSKVDVLLYSIDSNGTEEYYWTRVPPDYIRVTSHKINQLLIVKDTNGRNLAVFRSEAKTGRALIGTPLENVGGDDSVPQALIPQSQRPPMYWVDAGTLYRLVGAEVKNLVPSVQNATSLAVDMGAEKLYWTEKTSDRTGKIRRVNLDGTNVQLIKNLTSIPHSIAIDTTNDKLYLTNSWGKIQRINFDGSGFEPNLITGLDAPKHLTLDVAGGKFYWTEAAERIRRASLNGSNLETLVTGLGTLGGIAIADGKLYWTEQTDESAGRVQRANLDGSNVQTLASLRSVPLGITVDPMNRQLYWTTSQGAIQRANLDGNPNVQILVVGLGTPAGIVVSTTRDDVIIADLSIEKITGPWLWMIAPTIAGQGGRNSTNVDSLAAVSGGAVTEADVAANGANAGDTVGDYVWTFGEIAASGGDNVNDVISKIGMAQGDVDDHSAYALITLKSASVQSGVTMRVGSDDSIKVWLNGKVVHDNPINRGASDFQDTFKVNLVAGDNLLLVKVSDRSEHWTLFVGIDADVNAVYKRPSDVVETIDVADINADGTVNKTDLLLLVAALGENPPTNSRTDVNGDGAVNVADLLLVIENLNDPANAAAPSSKNTTTSLDPTMLTRYLNTLHAENDGSHKYQQAIAFLQSLLAVTLPDKTQLLANYPNPFNPETWIPYQLAKDTDVTLHIYAVNGTLVRTLALGHQPVGMYQRRSRAAYWDGRNALGEPVASGVYFYTFTAGDFTATRKMLIRK
ncbi:MAG: dockerin type I domain-containing protein [Candidatus Poribacteria bacterium]|nr:dockerin type I domain-containing protein [Candidatus Poribacteria bacterium]